MYSSAKPVFEDFPPQFDMMYPQVTPNKIENAALSLRLGLTSTLIRHENGAFNFENVL